MFIIVGRTIFCHSKLILDATKQLYKHFFRLSVCLWHIFHNVPLIASSWNFQEWLPLTEMMSMQKVKVRSQRSRSQKFEQILTQFGRFWAVTPVWIHRWWRNDAENLKWHRRGQVPYCFCTSSIKLQGHRGQKNRRFGSDLGVSGWQLQLECIDGYQITHTFQSYLSNFEVTWTEKSI